MSRTPSPEESREMLKWLNQNRQQLQKDYAHQYVAYNTNGIVVHDENLREVMELAETSKEIFSIYLAPEYSGLAQFVGIRFS